MKKNLSIFTFFVGLIFITTQVTAIEFTKPKDAIEYREGAFEVMQKHFSYIAAMAQGKIPFNQQAAIESAEIADYMGKLPWVAFGPGTQGGDSLPAIWEKRVEFDAAAKRMQTEMANLAAVTRVGDLDAIKKAVRATGASCKACHDDFRD
jgi:cytochrome c556